MSRIDEDLKAIFAYLDSVVAVPSLEAVLATAQCERAWSNRGYGQTYAAKAIHWYWEHKTISTDTRPKVIDVALCDAVLRAAERKYRYNVTTSQPCAGCQYLSKTENDRGDFCDRLIIWVAKPSMSTCPEFKPTVEVAA